MGIAASRRGGRVISEQCRRDAGPATTPALTIQGLEGALRAARAEAEAQRHRAEAAEAALVEARERLDFERDIRAQEHARHLDAVEQLRAARREIATLYRHCEWWRDQCWGSAPEVT